MRKDRPSPSSSKGTWLYGFHAVRAALNNPDRQKLRLMVRDEKILGMLPKLPPKLQVEIVDKNTFITLLGREAVHQGVALLSANLPALALEDILPTLEDNALLIILDEVTDPHNVGAILRSTAAFGASAVVMTAHNSPAEESGILAKTASGALEGIPLIRVTNLVRSIQYLQSQGFWIYGLDEEGGSSVHQLKLNGRIGLVFGAEGEGIRRLTRETCDGLLRLPTLATFATLNVSTSVAVALYEWRRQNL
jgi:23S rRNA (guanosine2251-2'-O)-methyltransferase